MLSIALAAHAEPVATPTGDESVPSPLDEPGAQRAGDVSDLAAGDWVVAQLDPSDGAGTSGSAHVTERLASAGSARAHLYGIAADHGLDPVFPDEVQREVEQLVRDPGLTDPELTDYRALGFVTIDGESSRDLDQAVHVAREGDGYLLRYALADAAHYVRPGTALFEEALRRGASYYLPGFMVPMLPRALSEGIVSLNPHVDRRALVFELHLDPRGVCTATRVVRGLVHSHAKLSFERAQAYLDDPSGAPFEDPAIDENLMLLGHVGRLRMREAEHRDVVRYRREEISLDMGAAGLTLSVHLHPRLEIERYNEQCSLLCNVEGAKLLRAGSDDANHEGASEVQAVYRVHPAPERDKVRRFERLLAALVRLHDLDPARFSWSEDGGVPLAEFLDALPTEGRLGDLARAIHRQAVMVNVRSEFRDEPGQHHGVGAEVYARFSAPMREIVGVFLHKELWELLSGEASTAELIARDQALRERIVERSNQAKTVQGRINQLSHLYVLDQLFAEDLARPLAQRACYSGIVMGLTHQKVHVTFDAPPVDVKLYVDDLVQQLDSELVLSDGGASLRRKSGRGVCRIGEPVRVRVDRWDASRKRFVLHMDVA